MLSLTPLQELTSNRELQTILSYHWGDYGTPPSKAWLPTLKNKITGGPIKIRGIKLHQLHDWALPEIFSTINIAL
jgi:hypothetical protein